MSKTHLHGIGPNGTDVRVAVDADGNVKMTGMLGGTPGPVANGPDYEKVAASTILGTLICRGSDAGYNDEKDIVNPILRIWVGTHCDAIADFGADEFMGDNDLSNTGFVDTTYWNADKIHMTAVGSQRLADILEPVLDAARAL